MTERPTVGDDLRQQFRVRACVDPSDCGERQADLSECLDAVAAAAWRRRRHGPVSSLLTRVGEHAVGASSVAVGVSSASALVAGVVDIDTGAGPADARAVVVAGDQWLRRSAAGAFAPGNARLLCSSSRRPVRSASAP